MSVIFEYTSPKYLSEDMKRVQALSMVCSGKKYEDSLVESVNHSMREEVMRATSFLTKS